MPSDDRAWPSGALPLSLVSGGVLTAVAIGMVVATADDGDVAFGRALGGTLVAAVGGWVYMTKAQRARLDGDQEGRAGLWFGLAGMAAAIAVIFVDQDAGLAGILAFMGALMLANARMIRVARASRPAHADLGHADLGHADPVDDGVGLAPPRDAAWVRRPATPQPRPTIGQVLHDAVAVRQRRWIAWLVAAVVSIPAAAALGAWPEAIEAMAVFALFAALVALLRVWPVARSRRRFARGDAPPRRAFVAVPFDAYPRLRPMLAIWSQQPVLTDGRIPRPERGYRIDPRHDALVCGQGDLEVHEAWVDTSSRRPRWVLADAGVAVPRRRAAAGRFYLLDSVVRVELPYWLTVTAPTAAAEPVTDTRFDWRRFAVALAQRLAVLAFLAVFFSGE